jgi:hypothetical protein
VRDDPVSPASSTRQSPLTQGRNSATDFIALPAPAVAVDDAPASNSVGREADDGFATSVNNAENGDIRHFERNASFGMEHGIYWRSRFIMVFATILGTGFCVAHHLFYWSLRGLPADVDRQQMYLR